MKKTINSKYQYMFVVPNCWVASTGIENFEKFIRSEFNIRAKYFDKIRVIDMRDEAGELISYNQYDALILVHDDDMVRAMKLTQHDERIQKFEIFLAKGHRHRYPHSVLEKYWTHFPEYLTWLTHFPPEQNVMLEILSILERLHTDMNTDVFINEIRKINNSYTGKIYLVDDYPETNAGKFNQVFVTQGNYLPQTQIHYFEIWYWIEYGLRVQYLESIPVITNESLFFDHLYSIHDDDKEQLEEIKDKFNPFEFHIVRNCRGIYSDKIFEKYFRMNADFKKWVASYPADMCLKNKMREILDEIGTSIVGDTFYEEIRTINVARMGGVANA